MGRQGRRDGAAAAAFREGSLDGPDATLEPIRTYRLNAGSKQATLRMARRSTPMLSTAIGTSELYYEHKVD